MGDPDEEAGTGDPAAPRDRADDPFEEFTDLDDSKIDFEEVFKEMETADLDDEQVWDSISEEEPSEAGVPSEVSTSGSRLDSSTGGGGDLSTGSDGDVPTPEGDATDAVVEKERYCQQCEYFSEPPEAACTNPGTEIVELVGVDRFLIRDCPVVAHRQRAETIRPDE